MIRYFRDKSFTVELEHGEQIPLGLLEEFIPKVYDAVNVARMKAAEEGDNAA